MEIEETPKEKPNYKLIWTVVILISIGLIFGSFYVLYSEVMESKTSCENINGTYQLSIFKGHLCNEKSFIKYQYCFGIGSMRDCKLEWIYEEDFNKTVELLIKDSEQYIEEEPQINLSNFSNLVP